ncbi:DUF3304 domain-containing protein [Aquabacterium sp. UBA2148]|uniref:DUF3304 domain-containing protein n=1 Tax=Aquabacterium sp. UBA2148 TaxID=1946042 RepID=UPI00257DD059|nr:DUF3304 domain-containing protein [Aquabacterium sp. UBA2148]
MLGITGFNYTDRYIDGFSVNGQGGTNMGAHTNGSGEACCIVWRPGTALPVPMLVEWTYGENQDLRTGQIYKPRETHRVEVELKGPAPKNPTVFAVHFYPDNTVQLEVAEDYPKPRFKRSGSAREAQS